VGCNRAFPDGKEARIKIPVILEKMVNNRKVSYPANRYCCIKSECLQNGLENPLLRFPPYSGRIFVDTDVDQRELPPECKQIQYISAITHL